jgi:glutaredoxin
VGTVLSSLSATISQESRLDERDDGADIQNYLFEKTGQRTVPNIFVGTQDFSFAGVFSEFLVDGIVKEHIGGMSFGHLRSFHL